MYVHKYIDIYVYVVIYAKICVSRYILFTHTNTILDFIYKLHANLKIMHINNKD